MPPDRHAGRHRAHGTSSGAGASSSGDRDSSQVRSVKKKIETLMRETAATLHELEEVEERKKNWKQRIKGSVEGSKAEFLRSAAAWRRKIDEHKDELERVRAGIDRAEPELEESRRRLKELSESMRARRADMERELKEKLARLKNEMDILNV